MGDLRYCFEKGYVARTLGITASKGLAVVDLEGISQLIVDRALERGVMIYGYINVGALEHGRPYFDEFKDLRIAEYAGWPGEWWVDVTSEAWQKHIVDAALELKSRGAIGIYFDNCDIYYMCEEGFEEERTEMWKQKPDKDKVYRALRLLIALIKEETGLVVMPNGGDTFVRRLFKDGYGYLIHTINQEGVLYTDNKPTPAADKKYYKDYLKWAKKQGLYIRGIEYTKSSKDALIARAWYKSHGYHCYISKHKNLCGD